MANPTGDAQTHNKIECRVSILDQGQGQETCENDGKVRSHFANNLIHPFYIDKFLKVRRATT